LEKKVQPPTMKFANPDISNPFSRTKKTQKSTSFLILLLIVTFGITALTLFYLTVSSTMSKSDIQLPHFGEISKLHTVQDSNHDADISQNQQLLDVNDHRDKLILTTSLGKIVITLSPELSAESVSYIRHVVTNGCERCAFYRAEKPGIFQGIMKSKSSMEDAITKGLCPPEYQDSQQECPPHDPNCACHGPIMTKGMVGWAGGGIGPDFFIDTYENPATHWGNQHT
jgi:hypothetical protein